MIDPKNIIPMFVVLPLGGAFLTSLFGKRIKSFPDIFSNIVTTLLLILSVYSIFLVNSSGVLVYKVGMWVPPFGISLVLDSLSSFMLFTINLIAFCIMAYSVNYMERYTEKWKFYTLLLLMLAGMEGVIITGDIFNLFVFLEIASVASYALVAYGTEAEELEASFKYLIMSSLGSTFVLLGIAFIYGYTSTLNMADIAAVLIQKGPGKIVLFIGAFFIMGFGLKSALVPFHAWLPDAHPSAPAPISAMLSGILIKALGVYALIRLLYNVLGVNPTILSVLMFMGVISMVLGVLLAIGQWDLKRLLAYHSISQIGYIFLGLGLGTPLGILGGLFHLFNHSVFKSLLFLNSGAVEYSIDSRNLKDMGGLREKMPVTADTSLVASMSIAGLPPFNGFWSKLIIIFAAVQAGQFMYACLAVAASILTLASFLKVQKYAFFGKLDKKYENIKEVPVFMRGAMIILAVTCIVSSIFIVPFFSKFLLGPAVNVLIEGMNYAKIVFGAIK
ncbi:MAG: monovalent cation/H+ antiporter subunit D family protein [Candidatus Omnitrophica bacterium]|nr:monovalent cation/H+ antiporter subunit D family protein [Candidatus Omnitrophota bacterium]